MRATTIGIEMLGAWLVLGACACSDDAGNADGADANSGGGSVFGDAPPSSDRAAATRIATRLVETTVTTCGGGCSADVDAGHASLRDGRMTDAWDAFKCADTPEAAFGAGIARVLGVLESAAGDAVMADLGLEPLPASDVFGPDGLLARSAARWNGAAQLMITGGLELQIASDHVAADDYSLELATYDGSRRVRFSIDTDTALVPGTVLAPQYDCTTGNRVAGSLPFAYLTIGDGDDRIECQLPSSLPAEHCAPNGGSLRVVANGDTAGARVEYELSELLLDCSRTIVGDEAQGDMKLSLAPVRLSGTVAAEVVLEIDTRGLHRIFQNDEDTLLGDVPANVASSKLMNHAAAVAGEIASARCYFAKAAGGSGTVFTLPGALYGGDDLALGPGDARMMAAASGLGAAMIELATSYELDLSIEQLACWLDDRLDEDPSCGTSADFVAELNRAVRGAKTRHDRLGATRALLEVALDDFETGVAKLDGSSALVRDAISAPGWDLALELVRAAQASLAKRTAVPHLVPAVQVDLHGFFTSPPEPGTISVPLLALNDDCTEDGAITLDCARDIDLEVDYLNAFFARHSDLDWDGDYEWEITDEIEIATDRIAAQLSERGLPLAD